jgi:ribosomal protein S18 acetylase RimI-like enzyme
MVSSMLSSLVVRPAEARDLDQLASLGAALARQHFDFDERRFLLSPNVEQGYRGWFEKEHTRKKSFLAVVDDDDATIAGYVYGRIEGINWAQLLDVHGALIDLFVREGARKRGVGKALVEAFCSFSKAQGAPRVVLSTATANQTAQALFAKLGFRPTMLEMTREA